MNEEMQKEKESLKERLMQEKLAEERKKYAAEAISEIEIEFPQRLLAEVRPDLLRILKDPELFKKINEEFDLCIVGEKKSRKAVFLVSCGRLVKNCESTSINLLVNDLAGTGKDHVVRYVLRIWPNDFVEHKIRISPTAFTYWHNNKFEPEFIWDDKVAYLEDVPNSVLNSDAFKVMASGKRGELNKSLIIKNQSPLDIGIIGKPVMIITMADASPKPELLRRFPVITLDGSENQTKAILKHWSKLKQVGRQPKYDQLLTEALGQLNMVEVSVPFLKKFAEKIDSSNIIMRTNFNRFCDYFAFSAALHQFQREINQEGKIIANSKDYQIAKDVICSIVSNKLTIPLTRNEKKVIELLKSLGKGKHVVRDFLHKSPVTKPNLYIILERLVEKGFVRQTVEADQILNKDVSYFELLDDGQFEFDMPKWEELV